MQTASVQDSEASSEVSEGSIVKIPLMIFITGVTGSGKKRQKELYEELLGCKSTEMSQLIRARRPEHLMSVESVESEEESTLLGDDDCNAIFSDFVGSLDRTSPHIIDGYPRTEAQARHGLAWARQHAHKVVVVVLAVSRWVSRERVTIIRPQEQGSIGQARPGDNEDHWWRRYQDESRGIDGIRLSLRWDKELLVVSGEETIPHVHNTIHRLISL